MSGQRYTPEFKNEAVRQVVERGYSVSEIAERLGVSSHSLYKWVNAIRPKKAKKLSNARIFTEVEFLSVVGVKTRLAPSSLWIYDKNYENVAAILPELSVPYEPVRYYLVCHSIELLLKAYLSFCGAIVLKLSESKYGHDLKKVLDATLENGLDTPVNFPDSHIAELKKAAVYGSPTKHKICMVS